MFEQILREKYTSKEEISQVFKELYISLESYLKVAPLRSYEIKIAEKLEDNKYEYESVLDYGVSRKHRYNRTILTFIDPLREEFINLILLRELYYLYLPVKSLFYAPKLLIHYIVVSQLSNHEATFQYHKFVRDGILEIRIETGSGFKVLHVFERMRPLFQDQTKFKSFFVQILKYLYQQKENKNNQFDESDFYSYIFNLDSYDFAIDSTTPTLEFMETIHIIKEIFYSQKRFLSLSEYSDLFNLYSEKHSTFLSKRKFRENLSKIKKETGLAPTFQLSWKAIGIRLLILHIQFNPHLNLTKIQKVIEKMPFLLAPRFYYNSFSYNLFTFALVPDVYFSDLKRFLRFLRNNKYIIFHQICENHIYKHIVNLNAFIECRDIVNPKVDSFSERYLEDFKMIYKKKQNISFNELDFLLFDRVRVFNTFGFNLEHMKQFISDLKIDLEDKVNSEHETLSKLMLLTDTFHQRLTPEEIAYVLNYIDKHKNSGCFGVSEKIREALTKRSQDSRKFELLTLLSELLEVCFNLHIYNIEIIASLIVGKTPASLATIKAKEQYLAKVMEDYQGLTITQKDISSFLNRFSEGPFPIIKPILINTIYTPEKEQLQIHIQLTYNSKLLSKIERISKFFTRTFYLIEVEHLQERKIIDLIISSPAYCATDYERIFLAITQTQLFQENLISIKPYIGSAIIPAYSTSNFYDFEEGGYIYSADLFTEVEKYTKIVFGKVPEYNRADITPSRNSSFIMRDLKGANSLFEIAAQLHIEYSKRIYNYKKRNLEGLKSIHKKLPQILRDEHEYQKVKNTFPFKTYIDSVKFIPRFPAFAFSQYHLFIIPEVNNSQVDLRLLLSNTFQKIYTPGAILSRREITLYLTYLFPFRSPNKSYLNWLTKSARAINQYCLFRIINIHTIFHFERNISEEGWELDAHEFKVHFQKIIADVHSSNTKEQAKEKKELYYSHDIHSYDLESIPPKIYGSGSKEYNSLVKLYDRTSRDIKTFLGTNRYDKIKSFRSLLSKDLIYPYLNFKNLGLDLRIKLIIPSDIININLDIDAIIKVFSFFNYAKIYEINGEFFIRGMSDERKFEKGIMIELFLPRMEISPIVNALHDFLKAIGVGKYLVLHNLISGRGILQEVFGDLSLLESYNPLVNLEWNERDKIWMNVKLFDEDFQALYPKLIK